MINAKEKFLEHTKIKAVKCAQIWFGDTWLEDTPVYNLPIDYNEEQCEAFLKNIDREYYNLYGGQELFGNIWYEDGTWSEREEYDGSEWWAYRKCPNIPIELK